MVSVAQGNRLAAMSPGPELAAAIAALDLGSLSTDAAVDAVVAADRLCSWAEALRHSALVAAAGTEPVVDDVVVDRLIDRERQVRIEDAVRDEVAAACRWSPVTAQHRIDAARLLAGPLRATGEALAAGEIGSGHAHAIVAAAQRMTGCWSHDDTEQASFRRRCVELQGRVLPIARRSTPARTRLAARRVVLLIDAAGERERRERARAGRDVAVVDDHDGISTLWARLATVDAHAILAAVQHAATDPIAADSTSADATAGDATAAGPPRERWAGERWAGERRAAALLALVLGEAPVHVALEVTIDMDALLSLSDQPGHLAGHGPLASDEIRALIADPTTEATVRRLVTDPLSGHLLDRGRRSYAVPESLRRFIASRDGTCRFPGCARRADRCEIDHARAWDDDGGTTRANLGALCTRHHQLKTHAGWEITASRLDGACEWRSPLGRHYTHDPPARSAA